MSDTLKSGFSSRWRSLFVAAAGLACVVTSNNADANDASSGSAVPAVLMSLMVTGAVGGAKPVSQQALPPLPLVEETPQAGQWGTRPEKNAKLDVTPPSFVWAPQKDIVSWELEVLDATSGTVAYSIKEHEFSVHRPAVGLLAGSYRWRYRGFTDAGRPTEWSQWREFEIAEGARLLALPTKEALLAKIPQGQPRLFLTPENIGRWREQLHGPMARQYENVRKRALRYVANRPNTVEPSPYLPEEVHASGPWFARWKNIWKQTSEAVAATYLIGFVALVDEDEELATFAVSLMDDLLAWDPRGVSSFDQTTLASYEYAWGMSRAYTFLYQYLSPEQRQRAREVLTVRAQRIYETHSAKQHLWKPFDSHLNRTWHFLGEMALVLYGDVPEAGQWLWYAMNVYANVYPVWGGEDGGWHEGASYHVAYMNFFMWWGIIMDDIFDINAYEVAPFFRNIGEMVIYSLPPNKIGAGWGDLSEQVKANGDWTAVFMENAARLSGNGYYLNYAERIMKQTGRKRSPLPIDIPQLFLDKYPLPDSRNIADLPASKVFPSTGQVIFNDSLTDAKESVQVQFRSSDYYGTFSHAYEANNSFKVWAYGERMLIKSGYRDSYGSEHHKKWMWSTRSVNNITVDGKGQYPHSMMTRGDIVDSVLGQRVDAVVGEAGAAYFQEVGKPSLLKRFTRALVFIKPATVVVVDYLQADDEHSFEYWLHASSPFELGAEGKLSLDRNGVTMAGQLIEPQHLTITQSDQYDPNPHDHVTLREWHLKAVTPAKEREVRFIAAYTFGAKGAAPAQLNYTLKEEAGTTWLDIALADGAVARLGIPSLATGEKMPPLTVTVADSAAELEQAGVISLKLEK